MVKSFPIISKARGMHWQIREISLIDGLISGAHRVNRVWASRISIGSSAIVTILDIRTGLVEVTINSQEEGGGQGIDLLDTGDVIQNQNAFVFFLRLPDTV